MPYEAICSHILDISSPREFYFYEPIWYYKPNEFPEDKHLMGQWLEEDHKIGQAMCYYVLTSTVKPIARIMVQPITDADMSTDTVKSEFKVLDGSIAARLATSSHQSDSLTYLITSIISRMPKRMM
jgi:hypothetical protein